MAFESPDMTLATEKALDSSIHANSYEVRLSESGKLHWLEQRDGQQVGFESEPHTSFG